MPLVQKVDSNVNKKPLKEMTLEELMDSLPLPPWDVNDSDPLMRKAARLSFSMEHEATSANLMLDIPTEKIPAGSVGASTRPATLT